MSITAARCELCHHRCEIPPGGRGLCRTRTNNEGTLETPFYGSVTALAEDPIEKKPLFHFRPGSSVLSAGFAGCNLRCPFCQNWQISQSTDMPARKMRADALVAAAERSGQIAYTYSEPLVHFEFILDCMKEARKRGIANVLVTNGCLNAAPASEILELTDAANIDLKCFSEETYSKILGGNLKTVLAFIRSALEAGTRVELTTLVVPDLNDSEDELEKCIDFIAELESPSLAVPWHLSAYHPGWKWKKAATPPELLLRSAKKARERLNYVYTGNIPGEENDTLCPHCKKILVSRRSFTADTSGIIKTDAGKQYLCASCKKPVPLYW